MTKDKYDFRLLFFAPLIFGAILLFVMAPLPHAWAQMSPEQAQKLLDQAKKKREAKKNHSGNSEQQKAKDQPDQKPKDEKSDEKKWEETNQDPKRWTIGIEGMMNANAVKVLQKSDDPDLRRNAARMPKFGIYILSVIPNSPAAKAGLHSGDIILSINGKRVESIVDFQFAETNNVIAIRMDKDQRWDHDNYKISAIRKADFFQQVADADKDQVTGDITYTYPASPKIVNRRCALFPIILDGKDGRFLALRIQYVADDWLFMNKIILGDKKSDWGLDFSFTFNSVNRDNSAYRIWEWTAIPITRNQLAAIVEHASNMIVRYEGREYKRDVDLGEDDSQAMKFMLHLWDQLQSQDRRLENKT